MSLVKELKSWPEAFEAQQDGRKHAELRWNDRNYGVGDHLILMEFEPATHAWDEPAVGETSEPSIGTFTGREVARIVTFAEFWPTPGVHQGYALLSTAPASSPIATLRSMLAQELATPVASPA